MEEMENRRLEEVVKLALADRQRHWGYPMRALRVAESSCCSAEKFLRQAKELLRRLVTTGEEALSFYGDLCEFWGGVDDVEAERLSDFLPTAEVVAINELVADWREEIAARKGELESRLASLREDVGRLRETVSSLRARMEELEPAETILFRHWNANRGDSAAEKAFREAEEELHRLRMALKE